MSDETTVQEATEGASASVVATIGKTYMQTYVRFAEYTRGPAAEDGSATRKTEFSVLPEQRATKKIKEAQEEHAKLTPEQQVETADLLPEIVVSQSCTFYEAKVIDELLPLCTAAGKEDKAEEIALGHFNRGAVLAQQQEIRGLLDDAKFEPREGVLDLAYAIAQKSEARAKSPEEKAAKALAALPQFQGQSLDDIQKLLMEFAASRAAV